MATLLRHLIGRRANTMLSVSILMYHAEGCAVLRRAELRCDMPRLCSIALWIESSTFPSRPPGRPQEAH
eukprot:2035850-Pyramimonas_sp.AAC.1